MLLDFKVKNYKSFQQEVSFSMIPAPKQKGLDYSVFEKKIDIKEKKQFVHLLFMVLMQQEKPILLEQWIRCVLFYLEDIF